MTEALKRLYEAMGWEFHDTVTDLVATDDVPATNLSNPPITLTKGGNNE